MKRSCGLDFFGKVAVVTGGASGSGEATCRAFAACGAYVVILDINVELGKRLEAELGTNTMFLEADVASTNSLLETARIVEEMHGNVNFLIGNAGMELNHSGNLITMPEADLLKILDVNLVGNMRLARAFVPIMKEPGGRIVFTGSVQSFTAHLPGTSYQASKAGLLGLARALAIELAPNITVNVVCPGAIKTQGLGAVRGGDPGVINGYRNIIPLQRRGHPEEVAGPILFLCSELANYINGASLVTDGGYTVDITPPKQREGPPRQDDPDIS